MRKVMVLCSMVVMGAVAAQAVTTFHDDFEKYDNGAVLYPPATANWNGGTTVSSTYVRCVVDDATKALSGTKSYCFYRPVSSATGSAYVRTNPQLRPADDPAASPKTYTKPGIVTASLWMRIGSTDPNGLTTVDSKFGIYITDSVSAIGAYVVLTSEPGNTNKQIWYYSAATLTKVSVEWPVDEYMNLQVKVNENRSVWGFTLIDKNGNVLQSVSNIPYSSLSGKTFNGLVRWVTLYSEAGPKSPRTDGFYNSFDDIAVDYTNGIPGDANLDNAVDVSDLGILAANYGLTTGATWAMGDFNGDAAVDVSDLGILAANYGTGSAGGADFQADSAKVFETSAGKAASTGTGSLICGSLGLPLVAGLFFIGLMLVKLED